MARFYTDENFPRPVIEFLRAMGHDVLTSQEAGNGIGNWELGIGNWELGIGNWELGKKAVSGQRSD